MIRPATVRHAALLILLAVCGCHGEPDNSRHRDPLELVVVGRLLLPEGPGSRGVEVQMESTPAGGQPRIEWVLFDGQGQFTHTVAGTLTRVTVTAGREVHRVDKGDLPLPTPEGRIDLGVIDLRDRLMRHQLVVRAAAGKPQGEVRVALFHGPPPVGPMGEPVSLGSRQFPPVDLGSTMEWLLPHSDQGVYFLVERPEGPGRGVEWRSGLQSLFGPFTSAGLPTELVID